MSPAASLVCISRKQRGRTQCRHPLLSQAPLLTRALIHWPTLISLLRMIQCVLILIPLTPSMSSIQHSTLSFNSDNFPSWTLAHPACTQTHSCIAILGEPRVYLYPQSQSHYTMWMTEIIWDVLHLRMISSCHLPSLRYWCSWACLGVTLSPAFSPPTIYRKKKEIRNNCPIHFPLFLNPSHPDQWSTWQCTLLNYANIIKNKFLQKNCEWPLKTV